MKIKGLLILAAQGFAFLDRCPELAGKLGYVKVKDSQGNHLAGWIKRRGRGLDYIQDGVCPKFYTEPSTDGVIIHDGCGQTWKWSGEDFLFNEPEYEVEFVEFKIGPVEGAAFLDNSPEFFKIIDSPGKKATMLLAEPSPNEPSAFYPEWPQAVLQYKRFKNGACYVRKPWEIAETAYDYRSACIYLFNVKKHEGDYKTKKAFMLDHIRAFDIVRFFEDYIPLNERQQIWNRVQIEYGGYSRVN